MTAAQMVLHVGAATGEDPELVNEFTWDLVETLRESPAERVERSRGAPEEGSKGTSLEWAELVVSFSGGLPAIVGLVRSWLGRQPGAKVKIDLDGDSLEIENASPAVQDQLIEAFLARHRPEPGP